MPYVPVANPIKAGRPKGSKTSLHPNFSIKERLKLLRTLARDEKLEARIRLAAIDLYSRIAGDSLKPAPPTITGTILGFQFVKTPVNTPNSNVSTNSTNSSSSTLISPVLPVAFINNSTAIINESTICPPNTINTTPNETPIPIVKTPVNTPNSSPNKNLVITPPIIPRKNGGNKADILNEITNEITDFDFDFKKEQDLLEKKDKLD